MCAFCMIIFSFLMAEISGVCEEKERNPTLADDYDLSVRAGLRGMLI